MTPTENTPVAPLTEEALDLAKSIENAHTELDKPDDKKAGDKDKKAASADDKKPDDAGSEKEKPKDDAEKKLDTSSKLSAEDRQRAEDLFTALQDPNVAKTLITELAKQAGVLETKEEKKEAIKSITELFKEQLGPEFEFIADKLGPALEKIIPDIVDKQVKDIRDSAASKAEAELNNEIDTANEKLVEEFDDYKDLQPAILKLMDIHLPAKGQKPFDYFTDLYHIAKGRAERSGDKKTPPQDEDKVKKNRENVAERLGTNNRTRPAEVVAVPKQMDLSSAIATAKAELAKG